MREKRIHYRLALGSGTSLSSLTVHRKPDRMLMLDNGELDPPVKYPVRRYQHAVDASLSEEIELRPAYQRPVLWVSKSFTSQWKRQAFLDRLLRDGSVVEWKVSANRKRAKEPEGAKRFVLCWSTYSK